MNVFIGGGCKNGKSHYAQELAKKMSEESGTPLYYVAMMISTGREDDRRIANHVKDRAGMGFITLEQPTNLYNIATRPNVEMRGTFLLDSITALLQNEMFKLSGEYELINNEYILEVSNMDFADSILKSMGMEYEDYAHMLTLIRQKNIDKIYR